MRGCCKFSRVLPARACLFPRISLRLYMLIVCHQVSVEERLLHDALLLASYVLVFRTNVVKWGGQGVLLFSSKRTPGSAAWCIRENEADFGATYLISVF